jgi:hypothetical protein
MDPGSLMLGGSRDVEIVTLVSKASCEDCPVWACLRTFLKVLCLVFQTTAPQDLEETEHFRHRRQQKVAKIVQCGEQVHIEIIEKASREMALIFCGVFS